MITFPDSFFSLLTTAPGSLIYHLVLIFSVTSTVQSLLVGNRASGFPHPNRLLLGLGLMLGLQGIQFLVGGLAWQTGDSFLQILPPLDRVIQAAMVICLIWLWCFPAPTRWVDAGFGVAFILAILFFAVTLAGMGIAATALSFNGTMFDWIWELATLVFILAGILALIVLQPTLWGYGTTTLAILAIGYTTNLLFLPLTGQFSGILRLASLCAFPLLPTLALRSTLPLIIEKTTNKPVETKREHPVERADPHLIQSWLQLTTQRDPKNLDPTITRTISKIIHPDACFMVSIASTSELITLSAGHDFQKDASLPDCSIHTNECSSLYESLFEKKPFILNSSLETDSDLNPVSAATGFGTSTNLLFVPFDSSPENHNGILLLNRASGQRWNPEDLSYLEAVIKPMVQIKRQVLGQALLSQRIINLQQDLDAARQEYDKTASEMVSLREALEQTRSSGNEINALLAVQQESQEVITNLQTELRKTQNQADLLQSSVEKAGLEHLDFQKSLKQVRHSREDRKLMASITRELRQPLASIAGYTSLLENVPTGETVDLQQKSIHGIQTALERLILLMDDLTEITEPKSFTPDEDFSEGDIGQLIDRAMTNTTALLREKNISLKVELPENPLHLRLDGEILTRVAAHLLHNAGLVTPENGVLRLVASIQQEPSEGSLLLLQVTDQGGGIAAHDLEHVFDEITGSQAETLGGLGDFTSGLSITRSLVESAGGRIWVDSAGDKTTFSILLPVYPGV